MTSFRLLIILLALVGLSTCDCVGSGEGYVYDAATGEPLVGATVQFLDTSESSQTDTAGFFELYFVTGFCPDAVYRVSKPGYKPFELEVDDDGNDVIYRVRKEYRDVALDPPFTPDPKQPGNTIVSTSFDRFSQQFSVGKMGLLSFHLERDEPAAELEEWKARMQSR